MFCHCSSSWKSCMMMSYTDRKSHHRFVETLAPCQENELYLVFENGMTFHVKGKHNYRNDNLDSSMLSVTGGDCRAWWIRKAGERNSNRQRGINYSYIPCMCLEGAIVHSNQWEAIAIAGCVQTQVFISQAQNLFYNTMSKCTDNALRGCCNYFSGFCPGNATNFPHGREIGGKLKLSLTIPSVHSSTQTLVHFTYIIKSKGINVTSLNIDPHPHHNQTVQCNVY